MVRQGKCWHVALCLIPVSRTVQERQGKLGNGRSSRIPHIPRLISWLSTDLDVQSLHLLKGKRSCSVEEKAMESYTDHACVEIQRNHICLRNSLHCKLNCWKNIQGKYPQFLLVCTLFVRDRSWSSAELPVWSHLVQLFLSKLNNKKYPI